VAIAEHTATLAAHEGTFKVINTKLDYITKGIDKVDAALQRHCEEEKR
jgi:hypothetical protein